MSQSLYMFTLLLIAGTVLLVFGLRYLAVTRQTQSRVANEEAYRDLATRASAAQADTATRLNSIQAEITGFGARLDAIEKILRDVG